MKKNPQRIIEDAEVALSILGTEKEQCKERQQEISSYLSQKQDAQGLPPRIL